MLKSRNAIKKSKTLCISIVTIFQRLSVCVIVLKSNYFIRQQHVVNNEIVFVGNKRKRGGVKMLYDVS